MYLISKIDFRCFLWILAGACTFSCQFNNPPDYSDQEIEVDLTSYQIKEGFEIEAVAAEPQVVAPVDMIFDDQGRIWVVEMIGYMTDFSGSKEDQPNGRISILEDRDGNGVIDHHTVFLDQLVMPRMIALVEGGLMYATPPELWWVPIDKNDRPGTPVLVDDEYAIGGNAEHQPNSFMLGVDNWYYNAKSNARYRYRNGEWEKEYTFLRGQWGMTQDEYGILYFNDNSNQFRGDYFIPGILDKNKNLAYPPGVNLNIVKDQSVHPLQFTAVNRGYMKGVLDPDSKKLREFTAASGILYYTGDQYDGAFDGDGFVGGPEANFVKRNTIKQKEVEIEGQQTYEDSEFLISWDESFRPVSLRMGPDGLIYIIDMHRGIIQHKTYLTNYLREQYAERGLDTVLHAGRILRILPKDYNGQKLPKVAEEETDLIELIQHPNSWKRLYAQQKIVESGDKNLTDQLRELLSYTESDYIPIHAFWTLEALDGLTDDLILDFWKARDHYFMPHALKYILEYKPELIDKIKKNHLSLDELSEKQKIYWAAATQYAAATTEEKNAFLTKILNTLKKENQQYAIYMALSQMEDKEEELIQALQSSLAQDSDMVTFLKDLAQKIESNKKFYARTKESGPRLSGLHLYESNCSTCHGRDAKGIENLAPPLYQTPFVEGKDSALVMIVLHGLQGPIELNDKSYEFPGVMPALADNTEYSDQDIAAVLSFIKNAFGRKPKNISSELVRKLRAYPASDGEPYTFPELEKRLEEIKQNEGE